MLLAGTCALACMQTQHFGSCISQMHLPGRQPVLAYAHECCIVCRRLLAQNPPISSWAQPGNVWQGQQRYTGQGHACNPGDYSAYLTASLQLTSADSTGLQFLGTINTGLSDLSASSYAQLVQHMYSIGIYYQSQAAEYGVIFEPQDSAASYSSNQQAQLVKQYGNISADGQSIHLTDTSNCVVTDFQLAPATSAGTASTATPAATSSVCPWNANANSSPGAAVELQLEPWIAAVFCT